MKSTAFDKFAGLCAILAGIVIFLYALAFIVIAPRAPELEGLLSALLLLLNGLLLTAPLTAIYQRLRETDAYFALWALILGLAGAFGAAIHGGFDLANAIHPPDAISGDLAAALATLPSQVDPRGLLTFGVAGVALFVVARLMGRGRDFPRSLGYLGYLLALLLVIIYVGRLIILNPVNPLLLVPILLAGFLVNPAWYIWLGFVLWRGVRV
jgi:hypothetical protein